MLTTDKKSAYVRFMDKCNSKDTPIKCIFELTFQCNLRCRHCYNTDSISKPLNTKQVKHILDQLAWQGVFFIIFTGGEIFMREDIFDILEYAHSKKFAITLFTNGTFIDRKKARQLSRYNIIQIEVSIYGPYPSLHDKITRTEDSFQRTVDAVRFLNEYNIRVWLKAVLFKDNFKTYSQIKKMAKDLGVMCIFNHILIPMKDGSRKNMRMAISTRGLSKHIAGIYKEALTVYSCDDYKSSQELLDRNVCSAGHTTLSIDPYGRLYPCLETPLSAGNLVNESLDELWRNSTILKSWRSIKLIDIEKCNRCKLVSKCLICPAHQLVENKTLRPIKDVCEMSHCLYKEANKLN